MFITHVKLQNWRNFRNAEADLREVSYVIGANATGKSNLLEVFRFLRDIAKPEGGGLQKAIKDRGGLKKIRCLHARSDPRIVLELTLSERVDGPAKWKYTLALRSEGVGSNRPIVAREEVVSFNEGRQKTLLKRPDDRDNADRELLTQTALEQIQSNASFREVAEHFSDTTYLHLVPQLLKFGEFIGGRQLENDPFGQAFLNRVAKTSETVRKSRLRRIEKALSKAVPQLEELRFIKDDAGHPHLEARYTHHRPNAGWQMEDQFSDGTLRLIALFWLLMENGSLLLLEEPELSLNEELVKNLPRLIERVRRSTKKRPRQIIVSTHSQALLENRGIDPSSILRLERTEEGTIIHKPSDADLLLIEDGMTPADVFLHKANPKELRKMELA